VDDIVEAGENVGTLGAGAQEEESASKIKLNSMTNVRAWYLAGDKISHHFLLNK
jgi:hypothetical protein